MDLLAHSVKTLGLRGVKYGPIYNRIPLSDHRMAAVYRYCVQNDLPLTLHMGTTYPRDCPIELGRPGPVEEIALQFPDLKIIMAHVGHPWFEECIVIARKQPNVYTDVSALHYRPWQYYNILITAQEYRTADKLYFGTDFPFAGVEESIEGLTSINRLVQGQVCRPYPTRRSTAFCTLIRSPTGGMIRCRLHRRSMPADWSARRHAH